MSRRDVIVIGGGLAGLAAAIACADAGLSVTLLEARPTLGGATSSFRRGALSVDTGQHVFLRCCTEYRSFLARIGSEGSTAMQPRLDIPVLAPGGRRARLRRSLLPAPSHLAPALASYRHLSVRERVSAGAAALALGRRPADPGDDEVSFGSWLASHGQDDRAIDDLWDVIARPTLNLSARDASLAMAGMVFRTGLLSEPSAADVGYARVPLARVHADPAESELRRLGAEIVRPVTARGVEPLGDEGVIVRADGGAFEARTAIVAVDHVRAADLVPHTAVPGARRLAERGTSPIVNVHVVYDRPVMAVPFAAAVRSPVQWVFDRTAAAGLGSGQYLAVSISAADREVDEPAAELRRRYVSALEALFPAARRARVLDGFVTRERRATFRATPGSGSLRPGPVTRWPHLFLAGAWTDTGWPATMEGAVRSGRMAAGLAIGRLAASKTHREGVRGAEGASADARAVAPRGEGVRRAEGASADARAVAPRRKGTRA